MRRDSLFSVSDTERLHLVMSVYHMHYTPGLNVWCVCKLHAKFQIELLDNGIFNPHFISQP